MEKEILSLVEAADFLCLSKDNVRNKVRNNEIPYSRAGRRLLFRKTALIAWVAKLERNSVREERSAAK